MIFLVYSGFENPSVVRTRFVRRGLVIGVGTVLVSAVCMLVTLTAMRIFSPPSDPNLSKPFTSIFTDFLVLLFGYPFAALVAAIAFPFAYMLLIETRLSMSIPFVGAVTIVATPPAVFVWGLKGAIVGLVTGIISMLVSRRWFPLEKGRSNHGPGQSA